MINRLSGVFSGFIHLRFHFHVFSLWDQTYAVDEHLVVWQLAVLPANDRWICICLSSWNKRVVNVPSDSCLLKNDLRHSLSQHFVAGRLFSLCWSVLPRAWWRSPHRSMAMCSCGADALCGSWLVSFHRSEGKLCTRGPSVQHSLALELHPKKNKWHEILLVLTGDTKDASVSKLFSR